MECLLTSGFFQLMIGDSWLDYVLAWYLISLEIFRQVINYFYQFESHAS